MPARGPLCWSDGGANDCHRRLCHAAGDVPLRRTVAYAGREKARSGLRVRGHCEAREGSLVGRAGNCREERSTSNKQREQSEGWQLETGDVERC